ncbi:hypothetical protein J2861_005070 [Agrobacterium tumefaciens]|nr:hypothetical protein [Agrobacterium tumefaciens]
MQRSSIWRCRRQGDLQSHALPKGRPQSTSADGTANIAGTKFPFFCRCVHCHDRGARTRTPSTGGGHQSAAIGAGQNMLLADPWRVARDRAVRGRRPRSYAVSAGDGVVAIAPGRIASTTDHSWGIRASMDGFVPRSEPKAEHRDRECDFNHCRARMANSWTTAVAWRHPFGHRVRARPTRPRFDMSDRRAAAPRSFSRNGIANFLPLRTAFAFLAGQESRLPPPSIAFRSLRDAVR